MAAIWASYRIAPTNVLGESEEARRTALFNVFKNAGATYWDQIASFIIVETDLSPGTLARQAQLAIAPSVDLVLVSAMDGSAASIVGDNDDPDIYGLIPCLTEI